jgi:uncharacterized protein YjbJ (UPF0337 family)
MSKLSEKAKGNAKKAVGAATRNKALRGEGQIADAKSDVMGTFEQAKASAKEIFEDARATQEEDYIRLGKPD